MKEENKYENTEYFKYLHPNKQVNEIDLKSPNGNLFYEYGNWEFQESPMTKSQFLFIRTGRSRANEFDEDLRKRAEDQPNQYEYYHSEQWNSKKYPFLLDSMLKEPEGIQQA